MNATSSLTSAAFVRSREHLALGTFSNVYFSLWTAVRRSCVIYSAKKVFKSADKSTVSPLFTASTTGLYPDALSDLARVWNGTKTTRSQGAELQPQSRRTCANPLPIHATRIRPSRTCAPRNQKSEQAAHKSDILSNPKLRAPRYETKPLCKHRKRG